MKKKVKVAFIGGGSRITVSVAHGLLSVGAGLRESGGAIEFALFDIVEKNAERIANYLKLLAAGGDLPMAANVFKERTEALAGADIVFHCASSPDAAHAAAAVSTDLGMGSESDGLAGLYFLARTSKDLRSLSSEIKTECPDSIFLAMVNPTDGTASFINSLSDAKCVGLCAEPYQVQDHLAYYLNVPAESVRLDIAGVNHEGWVVRFTVDGKDGYTVFGDAIREIHKSPAFRDSRSHRGWLAAFRTSGFLRSSPYHNGFFNDNIIPCNEALKAVAEELPYVKFQQDAIDNAIRKNQIIGPWQGHPHRGPLMYPNLGKCIGQYCASFVTGKTAAGFGQVPNHGAVENFEESAILELPLLLRGRDIKPVKLGRIPDWMADSKIRGHITQVRMIVDWLLGGDEKLLRQGIFASLPTTNLNHVEEYVKRMTKAAER